MKDLATLLVHHELLLWFVVMVLGLLLGRLQYRGARLGAAGVLFAGLAVGAWLQANAAGVAPSPQLKEFGLVLFVYCVGLASGPGLFAAWQRGGVRLNVMVAVALVAGALVAVIGGRLLGLDAGHIAGVFCGALTNTPALAAASDRVAGTAMAEHPVLGYSVTYPSGVLGALVLFRAFATRMHTRLAGEIEAERANRASIVSANLEVSNANTAGHTIGELRIREVIGVVVSRLRRAGRLFVPTKYTVLQRGDIVTVVGSRQTIDGAVSFFGARSKEHLEAQRDHVDMRRILVSRREHVACSLADMDLGRRFNAQVTRVRRADRDIVPGDDLRLELGDRLRVVAPADRLPEIAAFFGDSERELAELDYVALTLGLAAGLLLARVPLPVFGTRLMLGIAGGPLLVALILGRLERTGSLVWSIPPEANHVLREFGLLLFLAGVGVSAGGHLTEVFSRQGLLMVALGAAVTLVATVSSLALTQRWGKASVISSLGASSGMQTQPATLSLAADLSGRSEETYVAYALVYPLAMIAKILLAQLIVLLA
jgi:putative transport protein